MELITFNNIDQITSETNSLSGLSTEQIFTKYSHCFEGLGRISNPYHIKVDPTVTPVVHPPRKLPALLRDRVHRELLDVEAKGIIQKVDAVNSMVANEKRSGKLRICIDPRDLNKAILREHYQLPTQQVITSRLTGAKYFSKLDATSAWWKRRSAESLCKVCF